MKYFTLFFTLLLVMNENPAFAKTITASDLTARFEQLTKTKEVKVLIDTLKNVHDYIEYYDKTQWYVYHGDLVIDGDFDNDVALVVLGDLTIKGNYNDYISGTGFLVCHGNMRVQNLLSWNYFSVGQSLYAAGIVGAHYNDYSFGVYGKTFQSRAYYSQDREMNCPENKFSEIHVHTHVDSEWQCKKAFYDILFPGMSSFYDAEYEEISETEAARLLTKKDQVIGSAPYWEAAVKGVKNNQIFRQAFQYSDDPFQLSSDRLRYELMQDNPPPSFYEAAYKLDALHLELAHLIDTPVFYLEELITSPHHEVRQALASNSSTPISVLAELCKDKSEAVRVALVFNISIKDEVVSCLLKDESLSVQRALACTKYVLKDKEHFLNSKDLRTRQNVAANVNIDKSDREKILFAGVSQVKEKALEQTEPNFENISKFITSEDTTLQFWAIEKVFSLNEEERKKLLLPEQTLEFLFHPNKKIRAISLKNLIGRPFLSFEAFENHTAHFAKDELEIARIRSAQLSRKKEVLSILANDSLEIVRKFVAANYASPDTLLYKMSKLVFEQEEDHSGFGMSNKESFISLSLMENPHLPEEAFSYIRKIIPLNYSLEPHPNLPPEMYLEYENHDDPYDPGEEEYEDLQKAILLTGNRAEQLSFMAQSSRERFIDFAAQSSYTSLETLAYLFNKFKEDEYIMTSIASNNSLGRKSPLTEKMISAAANHSNDSVRHAFFENPSIAFERKMETLYKEENAHYLLDLKLLFWQMYGTEL